MKTAIVCEGGGMRGVFTAGVLQAFMEDGFLADELVGVSAGASNGVSYVSGQKGRGYRTTVGYAGDKRYVSFGNYLRTRSIFGLDFIFGEIPEKLDPFDYEAFTASPVAFYAGVTDVHTGKAVFFDKSKITPGLTAIKASCSLPVFSPIVSFEGGEYLDGGITAPIPLEKAMEDGCERFVVILTRDRAYRKSPQSFRAVYKHKYRQYPNLVRAIGLRHLVYNHTLERINKLEQSGQAVVVAPARPLSVDRFGSDKEEMALAYLEGCDAGHAAAETMQKLGW